LSGAALTQPDAEIYFAIEFIGSAGNKTKTLYAIPSAPGLAAAKLIQALRSATLARLALIFFRPVSEAGRSGIEELESQTTQLLSFQSAGQPVFDTQVAFNLLNNYGANSRENLSAVRARIRRELSAAAAPDALHVTAQVLHAPVFYGYTLSAVAELNPAESKDTLIASCRKAGFTIDADSDSPLGNLTASGDSAIHLAAPEQDPAQKGNWWFWGAADNVRVPASTAIKLAEKLVE
jgi:aspartate-semialdehyde dehydrogenase